MRESKALRDTKQDLNEDFYKVHEIYLNRVIKDRHFLKHTKSNKSVGCQFDIKDSNSICTCRNVSKCRRKEMTYFSGSAKHIYTYRGARSYTEVGIGNVKVLQKRKVKRVYLPETKDRGVGSNDWSTHFSWKNRKSDDGGYYKNKRTSSKCIGGVVDYRIGSMISKKLSPIIRTRSGTTSPSTQSIPLRNIEIGSNTVEKNMMTTTTQVENELLKIPVNDADTLDNFLSVFDSDEKYATVCKENTEVDLIKAIDFIQNKHKYAARTISSDSLIQHIHNLENPSQDKNSLLSLENKVEREYNNIFSCKEKNNKTCEQQPKLDLKRASVLRKRFEALRRGFAKKEDSKKKGSIVDKLSSKISRHSRKDVSIVSDPPSLEGRSYSNAKTYSPFHVNIVPDKITYEQSIVNNKTHLERESESAQWSRLNYQESDCQDVQGMFRLWGKKFNLEDDYYKKKSTPKPSLEKKKPEKQLKQVKNAPKIQTKNEKQGKKFFFFKKKIKDIPKEQIKSKKSITAGRCELSQGLMIKIGGNTSTLQETKIDDTSERTLQKHWLTKYVTQNIDSRNSVKIRWNNNIYNTSSSTIYELINTVYKETGAVFRSRSEVTTGESLYFQPIPQRVNFACKEIEAWMIPKTHHAVPKQYPYKINSKSKDNIEVEISNKKWFIDKSKAFSNKIQVVLHSNNLTNSSKDSSSSEYLRIDIPKGFFIDSSNSDDDKKIHSSDEEVYKIVEYETEIDSNKRKKYFETGDHKTTDIEVTVSVNDDKYYESYKKETVIKEPPVHRDVIIQGSTVNVPNRCNVIEVGIITQRDLRETRKPILNVPEFLTDEESNIEIHHVMKKCEFAESFLHDYYRNWTPLGPDLSSWRISDSNVKCCSENSESSFYNQGDGCKSCPNIYDDFQASAVISSNDPCGTCVPCPFLITSDNDKSEKTFTSKLFKKFKSKTSTGPHECCKRVLPKDSLEVFKRRKIYAASDKAKWACPSYGDVKPYSVPSIEDKEAQDTMIDCPKLNNSYYRSGVAKSKRTCKKHVSMPDCETMNKALTHQLTNEVPEGILTFKGAGGCEKCKKLKQKCSKHAVVDKDSVCKIVDPPCKDSCLNDKKAPCSKASSKSNNSFTCSSRPKSPITLCAPPIPCKAPSPKLPASKLSPIFCPPLPCSPPLISKPPPSCTPTPPFRSSKLAPLAKKCSLTCSPSKKSSSYTSCKKCQPKLNSYKQPCTPPRNSCSPTRSPCCKKLSLTKKLSHCRPCTKTQSSQTSPKYFAQNSKSRLSRNEYSCQSSPIKKRPIAIQSRCCSNKKENNSSSDSSICNKPPCRKLSPVKNETDDKYQWPLKNRVSNQSSLDSVACRPAQQLSTSKNSNRCKKYCPPTPNSSNQSLTPKRKIKKEKECKPDCANMPKMQERMPCLPPLICPPVKNISPLPSRNTSSKPKMSGLHLKMKPSTKKTCSEDCLIWQNKKEDSVIKLNCNDKITIRLKQQTPSTEEIREGMNIKVKDIDGQTLYERRDYIQDHSKRAGFILGDMYKSSNINTVSNPIIIKNVQTSNIKNQKLITLVKDDKSIVNLIEIQFKVKVSQGDKNTEININNNEDNESKTLINENDVKQPEEIFMVKNTEEHFNQDPASKNDVNIRIIIKNYKQNSKVKKTGYNDFSKTISEKFHTVSTGYSDVYPGQNADNVYSIHRATIDLTSSVEKSKAICHPNDACTNSKISHPEHCNLTATSNNTKCKRSQNKIDADNNEQKFISNDRNSRINSQDFQMDAQNHDSKTVSNDQNQISDVNVSDITSNEIIKKPKSKKEKKELLKKVFEKANGTTTKNKSRMKRLRDMLKMILTSDSSGPEDLTVTSNELAKDITYASLKPNYFRDTDSMNNYYKINSTLSLEKKSLQKYHPTEERNSECSANSDDTPEIEDLGCMCSILAEKLNLCKAGEGSCCCRDTVKRNENTYCDVAAEDDSLLINFNRSKIDDVETHNSSNKTNEYNNLKVKSHVQTNIIKHCPAILSRYKDTTNLDKVAKEGKAKSCSTKKSNNEERNLKKNRTTTMHMSNRDETIIFKTKPTILSADRQEKETNNRPERNIINSRETNRNRTAMTNLIPQTDILQSYETKRAVLEIYTESTMSDNREHLVAKLPKFVHPTVNEFGNYEKIKTNYKSVCKKHIVMSKVEFQ